MPCGWWPQQSPALTWPVLGPAQKGEPRSVDQRMLFLSPGLFVGFTGRIRCGASSKCPHCCSLIGKAAAFAGERVHPPANTAGGRCGRTSAMVHGGD